MGGGGGEQELPVAPSSPGHYVENNFLLCFTFYDYVLKEYFKRDISGITIKIEISDKNAYYKKYKIFL